MRFLNYLDHSKIPETDLYERMLIKYQKFLFLHALSDIEQVYLLEFLDSSEASRSSKLSLRIWLITIADVQNKIDLFKNILGIRV